MFTIAIAGLGTVGAGVVRLLRQNADLIAPRAGTQIVIKAVSAQVKSRKRDCDLSGIDWIDNPEKLAQVPGVDAVVELVGGSSGVPRAIAESALKNGKHFVTANKALIAAHGVELARLAENNKVQLMFEAAVAGGIPVIKTIREGLAGNRISTVRGILNGTCNYILTRMREAKLSFADALGEAQKRGYAEADPTADVDGQDTANKLAILAALAFGTTPDLASIRMDGIRRITQLDLQFAEELGCRIKLLGVARLTPAGLEQHVGPSLIAKSSPLARVEGALNAVSMHGDFIGDLMLEGQGAGAEPTASAVVADIIDLARGRTQPAFGVPSAQLKTIGPAHATVAARYYMRLHVMDKPGVVADISAILRDETISIESLIQRGKSATESVPVVITTHDANAAAVYRGVDKIAHLKTVVERPCLLQIED